MSRFTSVLALLLAALAVFAAPAAAAPVGHVIIVPGDSIDLAPIRVRTSGGCPAPADAYFARVHGHGFPREGQLVTPNTAAGLSRRAGFDVYFAQTMKDFADDNNTTLTGRYDITVYCVDSFTLTSYGEFTGAMEFSTPKKYTALGLSKPTGTPPPPIGAGEPVAAPPGGGEFAPDEVVPPPAADGSTQVAQGEGDSAEDIDLLPILLVAAGAFALILAVAGWRRWRHRSAGVAVLLVAVSLAMAARPAPATASAAVVAGQPPITIGVVIPTTTPTGPTDPTDPTDPTGPTTTAPRPPGPTDEPPPAAGPGGGLGYTGSPVGLLFAAGLALLAAGTAAVMTVRRRRQTHR